MTLAPGPFNSSPIQFARNSFASGPIPYPLAVSQLTVFVVSTCRDSDQPAARKISVTRSVKEYMAQPIVYQPGGGVNGTVSPGAKVSGTPGGRVSVSDRLLLGSFAMPSQLLQV